MKHNYTISKNNAPCFLEAPEVKKSNRPKTYNKSGYRSFLLPACFFMMLLFSNLSFGQVLSTNDFNFAGNLTANGWTAHSGAATNPVATTTGLTYTGLLGSGIGNAALVNNLSGEDVNITFANQNTDGQSIYYSFMVKVTEPAATKAGDFFLHIGTPGGAVLTSFAGRVFAKVAAGVVNFGLSNTATATYGTTPFATNATYLLIVKYTINVAGNDATSLWVVTSGVPATEVAAGATEVTNTITAGQNAINAVALRQGSATNSAQTVVDGILVGTTWASVTPVPATTMANISQPTSILLQGAANAVLAGFTLSATSSSDFTSATVTGGGSATAADINTVRIFRDNDGNGAINGADASVSGAGNPFSASIALSITGETGIITTRNYLIVANVDAAADVSRNVSVAIAPGAYVASLSPNNGSMTGALREIDAAATPTINLTGALTAFTTSVGTPSATQSYTVDGTNLGADIIVTPPAEFKIRIDANAFSSSPINITPAQAAFPGKTIDVQYDPAASGSHGGNITHTSTGALQKDKAVTGTSFAAEPTTQASVTFGAITNSSIVINFSGGNGSARVVVVRDLSAVSFIPTDGVASVSVNSLYFSLASPNGNKIVYDGVGNTVTVTGLNQLKVYHVAVYEYNGSGTSANYLTTTPGINNTTTLAKVIVPVPMVSQIGLTYTENFNDEANWGDGFNFGTGTESWGGIDVTVAGAIPDGVNTTRSTLSFITTSTSGGVQRGTLTAAGSNNVPGSLVLLSTGSPAPSNACAIDFHLNFTGVSAGTLSFNWESVINSTGDRPSFLRIFTSINGTTFTELTGAAVLNIANGAIVSGSVTNVALPPSLNNVADATIRFYDYNGIAGQNGSAGSRAKISIKDVTVTAGLPPTKLVVTNINPASPTQNASFSVTVQAQDAGNNPQNVLTNTNVLLTLITGGGSLTGTLTGTILAGTNNVIITGVLYNLVENGIVVEASRTLGDVLASGNSAPFNVIAPTPTITLSGTLLPFLTGVGTESAFQSYTVKGEYLTANIVVTPPLHFKIRIDADPFSSSAINLTPAQVVTPKTIDVVYAPGGAGPHSGDITHTSTNATTQNEAVSGNTVAAEPTTASAVTMGCSTNGSIIVNFTGGSGSSRIVVASASNLATFTPVDGFPSAGTVSSDFSLASDQGGGDKIVYDASGSTVTVTGLLPLAVYYFRVYEYNGSGAITEYLTSSVGSGNKSTLGPISYVIAGSTYTQDFDGLPLAGPFAFVGNGPFLVSACPINASNASGWQFGKTFPSLGNAIFTVDNGSGTSGSAYSYGTTASPDRALGSLGSGGQISNLGVKIINNTTAVLNTVSITYTGEQWRNGGSGNVNSLAFSYSLDGTDIFTGTYTPVSDLNFSSIIVGGTAGALDGDAAANRAVKTKIFTLNGNWLQGQALILRWDDIDNPGSEDGLAIDDFSFYAIPPVDPTVQDYGLDFPEVTTTSIKVKWINGNGANHLVKMNINPPGVTVLPLDLNGYAANPVWQNTGEQVVYSGVADSVIVTGLSAGTLYEFRVFGFNGSGVSSMYNTSTALLNPSNVFTESASPPTKLVVLSVNGGANPTVNQAFSVVVQARDNAEFPQNVSTATTVLLEVSIGTGTLSGTISGQILAGSNTVTITGVIYNPAENNVQLEAKSTAGDVLAPGQSALFDVLDIATQLSFGTVPTNGIVNTVVSSITVRAVRPDNTVDANYVGNITIAVNTGPGGISGTLTQPTVGGVATFNNIQFNAAGAYTLVATSLPALAQGISSTINITAVPVMTELVVPRFMGSKSAGSSNTNRTPIAVCLRIDNLVPNTTYDLRAGFELVGAVATFYGAGNSWLGSGSSFSPSGGTTIQNVFTTDGSGSSGPFWIYMQPTGNSSRFGAGQVHNIRIGYVIDGAGNPPAIPNFIGTETITTLDIAATALTVTGGDDGAFLTGVAANCAAGKYILVYNNVAGTGRPLFSYQARQANPNDTTNASYSGFLSAPAASIMKDLYMQNGASVVGQWPAVIPIGAINPGGVQRVEARNADNTIFGAETEATGIWPGGANTTTITKRGVATLLPSDAPISILISNLSPAMGCNGTAVVITGSHFTGATNVSFNGVSDPGFVVDNDNQISATVPVGATTGIVTVTSATACVGNGPSFTVVCNSVLTSNILLEGFYLGGGTMQPCMNIIGVTSNPNIADVISISAMDAAYPSGPNGTSPVDTQTDSLDINGNVTVTFGPAVIPGGSYYLKVNHRNHLETWSAAPVTLGATATYLFSSNPAQALFGIEALSFDGYGLMYTGDISQDNSVDATDFLLLDPEIQAGAFGYFSGDLNGDGSVDATDFLFLDPNIQLGVASGTP